MVEGTLNAKRLHVERLERVVADGAKRRQDLLAKGRETIESASCQLFEIGKLLQDRQLNVATMTANLRERRKLAS